MEWPVTLLAYLGAIFDLGATRAMKFARLVAHGAELLDGGDRSNVEILRILWWDLDFPEDGVLRVDCSRFGARHSVVVVSGVWRWCYGKEGREGVMNFGFQLA